MAELNVDVPLKNQDIQFGNQNKSRIVFAKKDRTPAEINKSLGLTAHPAIIHLIGGANKLEEEYKGRLVQMFSRAIATAALESDALIVDGGTDSGIMALMGLGVADRGYKTNLLGIAPAGLVTFPGQGAKPAHPDNAPLEPNHSHFVLTDGDEWGTEKGTMFKLIRFLSKNASLLTILVNGGPLSKIEVLNSVRQGHPVLVIEGSGRLADEIAVLWKKKPAFIEDPMMAEIIADGKIHFSKLGSSIPSQKRLIKRLLAGNSMLRQAWDQFAIYDINAERQQNAFHRLQSLILSLAVFGTLLAIIHSEISPPSNGIPELISEGSVSEKFFTTERKTFIADKLHFLIILVPITVSIFISIVNRFKFGNKWIVLRAAAEEIKQEIFKYRTQTGIYSVRNTRKIFRDSKLAQKLKTISVRVMQTEVNVAGLKPYAEKEPSHIYRSAKGDDGLRFLSSEHYLAFRVEDQLKYYRKKTLGFEKQLKRFQWMIYLSGGIGTMLAAMGAEIWIALTTAMAGSFTTYLQFKQTESTLMHYNQTAADLGNIRHWWIALTNDEQCDPQNIDKLVSLTENIFRSENSGWLQQMQDMLDDMREDQKTK